MGQQRSFDRSRDCQSPGGECQLIKEVYDANTPEETKWRIRNILANGTCRKACELWGVQLSQVLDAAEQLPTTQPDDTAIGQTETT